MFRHFPDCSMFRVLSTPKSFISIFFIGLCSPRKFSYACFCKNYCFHLYVEYFFFFFSVLYQHFDGLFHAMPWHVHRPISGLIFACLIYRIHASHSNSLARKLLYLVKCYFIPPSDPDLRQDPVFPRCCLSKWSLQELFGKTDWYLGF